MGVYKLIWSYVRRLFRTISVDALELGLALQKKFSFRLDGENTALREHFHSVATLADFIGKMKTEAKG